MLNIVFIIGAASNNASKGQLPDVDNLKQTLQESKDDFYFIFIDPVNNQDDKNKFNSYIGTINFIVKYECFIPGVYLESYFEKNKKGDVYIINYTGISEYEFIKIYGRDNIWYYCPGCISKKLDFYNVFKNIKQYPRYLLEDNIQVPKNLSVIYKEELRKDISNIICLVKSKEPYQDWLKEYYNFCDIEIIKENALIVLKNFCNINNIILDKDSNKWYSQIYQVLK